MEIYKFILKSRKGDHFGFCDYYTSDFNLGHGEDQDVNKCITTKRLKKLRLKI